MLHWDGFSKEKGRVGRGNMCLEEDFAVPDEVEVVSLNKDGERAMHCEI